ncbi:DoxX family membrane protein [Gordonia sp. (in: high G+C Gram-positive bacteria)]|uniref:DoxX family protein n=1 Tax=Gordonia sp. (in: high G+C Gram-positive bacteria) TaxID=84139 RepID=UPI0039E31F15
MGSHRRRDESDDAAEREDKHRVEQSRIPAPPSGFARVDSLDDLDQFPSRAGGPAPEEQAATPEPAAQFPADPTATDVIEPVAAPVEAGTVDAPVDTTPAPDPEPVVEKPKRSHRWGRKTDTAEVPTVDTAEHPPLPDVAPEEEPLPETVPTEAVHPAADDAPTEVHMLEPDTGALAAVTAVHTEPEPAATVKAPVPVGQPYEEHDEALRSRRITDLEDQVADLKRLGRRGTTDLGLLVLRLAIGAYLAVDGCRKLFGWMGGPSLNGFETDLLNTPKPEIGFSKSSAGAVAMGWSVAELVVGVVLIAGFLAPLIAAVGLAVASLDLAWGVTKAGGVHLFADQADQGGIAFQAALWVMLVVLILCGPGRYSLDGNRGWARRPGIGSLLALVAGVALAVLVWVAFNGTNPLASTGNRVG